MEQRFMNRLPLLGGSERLALLKTRGAPSLSSPPLEASWRYGCAVEKDRDMVARDLDPLEGAKLAEREGFEPTVVLPTHAFQACALNHSAISPPSQSKVKESSPACNVFHRSLLHSRRFACLNITETEPSI